MVKSSVLLQLSSALADHILRILSVGTKKQMIDIDTGRGIARVAHALVGWYRAYPQLPGQTVRLAVTPTAVFSGASYKFPVASGILSAGPKVTAVFRNVHFFNKALFGSLFAHFCIVPQRGPNV